MPPLSARCLAWAPYGGHGEWVITLHCGYITFLQSPKQPGTVTTKATQLRPRYVILPLSRHFQGSTRHRLCVDVDVFGAVSALTLEQWKQQRQGSGRCEVVASESKQIWVWKEVCLVFPWKNMSKWLNLRPNSDRKKSLDAGGQPIAFFQKHKKREWSLPWPTDIMPQLCKKKHGEKRR